MPGPGLSLEPCTAAMAGLVVVPPAIYAMHSFMPIWLLIAERLRLVATDLIFKDYINFQVEVLRMHKSSRRRSRPPDWNDEDDWYGYALVIYYQWEGRGGGEGLVLFKVKRRVRRTKLNNSKKIVC